MTTAEKEEKVVIGGKTYSAGASSVVDMEGYSNPPGEVPYRNGSALVAGFLFKLCPKF